MSVYLFQKACYHFYAKLKLFFDSTANTFKIFSNKMNLCGFDEVKRRVFERSTI